MQPVKLNWTKVDKIRAMYEPGVVGYKILAREFGVSITTIKSIVHGETWPESRRPGARTIKPS